MPQYELEDSCQTLSDSAVPPPDMETVGKGSAESPFMRLWESLPPHICDTKHPVPFRFWWSWIDVNATGRFLATNVPQSKHISKQAFHRRTPGTSSNGTTSIYTNSEEVPKWTQDLQVWLPMYPITLAIPC